MKTYATLKKEKEDKLNNFMTEVGVFWAFSNEQFAKNKVPIAEGDTYVSLGMGGYLPKSKVQEYLSGMEKINTDYKKAIKEFKQEKAEIVYELHNHEAFYTGHIDDAMEALPEYSREEVTKVFYEEYANQG